MSVDIATLIVPTRIPGETPVAYGPGAPTEGGHTTPVYVFAGGDLATATHIGDLYYDEASEDFYVRPGMPAYELSRIPFDGMGAATDALVAWWEK